MNVLVSGSHGLIGSSVVFRLEQEGHRVARLVRPGPGAGPAAPGDVGWDPVAGRIDRAPLNEIGPVDAVVNLAGAGIGDHRWTPDRRRLIDESRRRSTRLLSETLAALSPPPSVLVSGSAIGIYGDRGDVRLTEDDEPGRGFLPDVCRAWEAATSPASGAGIRVVCLRTGIVLSRSGGVLARLLPLFRLGLGGRLGTGRQFVSWITREDEVDVIVRAIGDDRLSGPLNAVAPAPVTNAELTRALGRALHRPTRFAVPSPALAVALGKDLSHELLLSSTRVVPAKLQAIGYPFAAADIDTALASVLDRSR